jgi:hypothetical protein
MPSFREMGIKCKVEGFHRHHLIPVEVVERPSLAIMFGHLRAIGFDPQDFGTNGMHLPCTEKMAMIFALPLHRGPHPQYNEMVAERVAAISHLPAGDAYLNIRFLQQTLRYSLRRPGILRGNNTPRLAVDLATLETDANMLHGLIDAAFKQ